MVVQARWAALLSIGGLLSAAAEAGSIHWVSVGPPGNPAITAVAAGKPDFLSRSIPPALPPEFLFAAASGVGVLRSDDSGDTWKSTGPGLQGHDAVALALRQELRRDVPLDVIAYSTTVFAGTAGAGVYRLAPGATAWISSNAGLTSLDIRALAVGGDGVVANDNRGVVYAGTADGLFASTDGGDTWIRKTAGLPSAAGVAITSLASDPSASATLYAGTTAGLFKSVDGGETWSQLDPVPGSILFTLSVAVDPLVPSRLYADGAKTLPCAPVCLPIAFLLVALRSLDDGATWSPVGTLGANFVRAFAATPNLPSRAFAGAAASGVFESDDAGATWTASNDGLGDAAVSLLVIDPALPSLIFAGTSRGVFRAPLGQTAVTCFPGGPLLCLNAQRFSASVVWRAAGGATSSGQAAPITDNTGAFWFFDPTNLELVIKVLDARSVNGKFWVFYGALSNVEYTVTVTDTLTGAVKTYFNPQGQLASVADTSAF
jgi:hypothetical protein